MKQRFQATMVQGYDMPLHQNALWENVLSIKMQNVTTTSRANKGTKYTKNNKPSKKEERCSKVAGFYLKALNIYKKSTSGLQGGQNVPAMRNLL